MLSKRYLILFRVFVQGAPIPTSTQQTSIPDPQPHRGPARTDHLLCGGEQVSQGGSLSFWAQVLNAHKIIFTLLANMGAYWGGSVCSRC